MIALLALLGLLLVSPLLHAEHILLDLKRWVLLQRHGYPIDSRPLAKAGYYLILHLVAELHANRAWRHQLVRSVSSRVHLLAEAMIINLNDPGPLYWYRLASPLLLGLLGRRDSLSVNSLCES